MAVSASVLPDAEADAEADALAAAARGLAQGVGAEHHRLGLHAAGEGEGEREFIDLLSSSVASVGSIGSGLSVGSQSSDGDVEPYRDGDGRPGGGGGGSGSGNSSGMVHPLEDDNEYDDDEDEDEDGPGGLGSIGRSSGATSPRPMLSKSLTRSFVARAGDDFTTGTPENYRDGGVVDTEAGALNPRRLALESSQTSRRLSGSSGGGDEAQGQGQGQGRRLGAIVNELRRQLTASSARMLAAERRVSSLLDA